MNEPSDIKAAQIAKLRAENERLTSALERIAALRPMQGGNAVVIAAAALSSREGEEVWPKTSYTTGVGPFSVGENLEGDKGLSSREGGETTTTMKGNNDR